MYKCLHTRIQIFVGMCRCIHTVSIYGYGYRYGYAIYDKCKTCKTKLNRKCERELRKGKWEVGKWDVGKGNTVNSLLKYPMRIRWAKAKSKFEFESDSESKLVSTALCFINDDNSLWLFISIVRRRSGRLFPITVAQDANHYSYKQNHTHTHKCDSESV